MIKTQTLYVNFDSPNPHSALVVAPANTQPTSLGSIVAGDTLNYVLVGLTSTGATSSLSGNPDYRITVALGTLGDAPLATSTNFVASASAWTGSINSNTASLLTVLGTVDTYAAFLEIQVTVTGSVFDSGSRYTILQTPITIRNQIIT